VEAIVRALNSAGLQYLIVGGLAVNAHGYVRLTRHVDIVLRLDPVNVSRALSALFDIGYQMSIPAKPEDFANQEMRENWRRSKGMITLKLWSDAHQRTPINIFVYEPFDFAKEYAAASWEEIAPDLEAPVVRCKTLMAMKRVAARPQDLADIAELEKVQKLKEGEDSE